MVYNAFKMNAGDKLFKVAAIQMTSINDKKVNLKKAERFISLAAEEGAKVVVLPEMFNFSGKSEEKRENAEPVPGPTINQLKELVRKFKIYLLCGSILEKSEEKGKKIFYNTSVFLNPRGEIIARYRKLHLFDVILPDGSSRRESELITPGDQIVQVVTPVAVFGLSICYDLRFPELYRRLAKEGVQVVFVPSAFTLQTGKDHWETLVKARAIENQFYLIAPDQTGKDPEGKRYWGKSMIVDPWGTVLAKAPENSHMREDLFSLG